MRKTPANPDSSRTVRFTLHIREKTLARFEREAASRDVPVATVVRDAMALWLKQRKGK